MTLPAGSRTTDHALQHRGQRHVALVAAALALLSAAGRVRAAVPRDAVPGALCPESMRIESMILAFVPRDPAALDALLHEQLDPRSPRYHAWLTPTAFGDRFGAPAAAYAQALAWLAARGFERVRPWPGRLGIGFDGPAGRVRRAPPARSQRRRHVSRPSRRRHRLRSRARLCRRRARPRRERRRGRRQRLRR